MHQDFRHNENLNFLGHNNQEPSSLPIAVENIARVSDNLSMQNDLNLSSFSAAPLVMKTMDIPINPHQQQQQNYITPLTISNTMSQQLPYHLDNTNSNSNGYEQLSGGGKVVYLSSPPINTPTNSYFTNSMPQPTILTYTPMPTFIDQQPRPINPDMPHTSYKYQQVHPTESSLSSQMVGGQSNRFVIYSPTQLPTPNDSPFAESSFSNSSTVPYLSTPLQQQQQQQQPAIRIDFSQNTHNQVNFIQHSPLLSNFQHGLPPPHLPIMHQNGGFQYQQARFNTAYPQQHHSISNQFSMSPTTQLPVDSSMFASQQQPMMNSPTPMMKNYGNSLTLQIGESDDFKQQSDSGARGGEFSSGDEKDRSSSDHSDFEYSENNRRRGNVKRRASANRPGIGTRKAKIVKQSTVEVVRYDEDEERVVCQHCHKTYRDIYNLKRHIRDNHGFGRTKYVCECGSEFVRKDNMKQHQQTNRHFQNLKSKNLCQSNEPPI